MKPYKNFTPIGTIIILISVLIGSAIISPLFKTNLEIGALIGGLLGIFIINVFSFLKKEKNIDQEPSKENNIKNNVNYFKRVSDVQRKSLYRSFVHPTQLPITLSIILFALIVLAAFLFEKLNIKINPEAFQYSLLGISFLWGLSGFLMLSRNEYIDKNGNKYKGFWAILNGVIFVTFGWGLIIYLVLAKIFNW